MGSPERECGGETSDGAKAGDRCSAWMTGEHPTESGVRSLPHEETLQLRPEVRSWEGEAGRFLERKRAVFQDDGMESLRIWRDEGRIRNEWQLVSEEHPIP